MIKETHVSMTNFTFQDATKDGSYARIGLAGPPGSGKTWSALEIAKAFTDRPYLIDTERRSAAKYSDRFRFRHLVYNTFDPEDLTRGVLAAGQQGAELLIIDTWSPFWAGTDGMLDRVGKENSSFEGWRKLRPVERTMMDAIFGAPMHVIVTMRVKVEYTMQQNGKGKMEPVRVGMTPEQRNGVEYEFDVFADMDDAGRVCRITKTRCPELAETTHERPTEELGHTIRAWLERDAVGMPLNPFTVRDWMLQPERTPAELDAKIEELTRAGQLTFVIEAPNGQLFALGDALVSRRNTLLRAGQREGNGREPSMAE